jgi:hypothetical protein
MRLHPSITIERVRAAVERGTFGLDNPGFCINCGLETDDCEPDARSYVCDECGQKTVYGAEEIMFHVVS